MDILKDIIYAQNKELLTRMANDLYIDNDQKEEFIQKYHKLNYCIIAVSKKDNTKRNLKNILHCVK
tara:strand:+ start:579 stop:776 length:198 start_codon:yes stop_codon:yes gene_type:complete